MFKYTHVACRDTRRIYIIGAGCTYTMKQKFSKFYNPIFVMIKYTHVLDMRFIGSVLHNFIFHDNFACFSYVNGLPRDVEEIMEIACPAFHVHHMS